MFGVPPVRMTSRGADALEEVPVRVSAPGLAAVLGAPGPHRHHLVCRGCGVVVDVDCPADAAQCLPAGDVHGFAVEAAEVVHTGSCPDCRAAVGDPAR
jgi:Fur family ferric uptake transcriptional regulator